MTRQYVQTQDVLVAAEETAGDAPQYVYLSVFNDRMWKPVAWAENKGRGALFRHLGCEVMYLPTYYRGKEERHFSAPFYIKTDGSVHYLHPDTTRLTDIRVRRKYPLEIRKMRWASDLQGCYLEASHTETFEHTDTLAVIRQPHPALNWLNLQVDGTRPYRYWRLSKGNSSFALSELEFYDAGGRELRGRIYNKYRKTDMTLVDKDKLSFAYTSGWVGIDFGQPVLVSNVCCLSRTDDNGINAGDTYELLYYDGGWLSLGTRVAESDELVFHGIPSNALYWLRNLNSGKEERIFICRNGRIEFW